MAFCCQPYCFHILDRIEFVRKCGKCGNVRNAGNASSAEETGEKCVKCGEYENACPAEWTGGNVANVKMWQIPTANGLVVYMINVARRKVLEGRLGGTSCEKFVSAPRGENR